jgi:uncharacterized protein (DUF1810 family)
VADSDPFNLYRFVDAQDGVFDSALAELRAGRKQTHWMWFVFPQLAALGRSSTAQYYGIRSHEEAAAYLVHAVLGPRLRQSVEALLPWVGERTAEEILGPVDALKLKSSLTLFDGVSSGDLFEAGLRGFYGGEADEWTLALLNAER